jgi:GT2 family glycosyltransferase
VTGKTIESRIGVITVNHGSTRDTVELLESLAAEESGRRAVVCVVDNGSSAAEERALREHLLETLARRGGFEIFPEALAPSNRFRREELARAAGEFEGSGKRFLVVYVALPENVGFAAASNLGYRLIGPFTSHLLIVNNDMVVERRFLDPLLEALAADERAVGATGKIYRFDPPDVIWYAGGRWSWEERFRPRHLREGERETSASPAVEPPRETAFASGALILLETSFADRHGLFCEGFFFGEEDAELCHRVREAGRRMLYVPQAVARHKVGASREGVPAVRMRGLQVRRKYLMLALTSPWFVFVPWLVAYTPVRIVRELALVVRGRSSLRDLGRMLACQGSAIRYALRMRWSRSYRASQFEHRSRALLGGPGGGE